MSHLSAFQNMGRFTAFLLYAITDFICVGAGMGVPIFCIFLGLPVGWYAARASVRHRDTEIKSLRHVLFIALATSAVTCAAMLLIWGRCIPLAFDNTYDFSQFGHPMILYAPRPSFVAWLVLMILISPILQLLVTMFAAHITLMAGPGNGYSSHTHTS